MQALTSQQRYLPFGGTRAIPNSPILATDFGYTGQRLLDAGMGGIMDYKARFYSVGLGRFLQPDTIIPDQSNPQSWNRFSYVENRPIRFNDPTGHMQESDDYECYGCTLPATPPGNPPGGGGGEPEIDLDNNDPITVVHHPNQGIDYFASYDGVDYYIGCGSNFLVSSPSPSWATGGAPTICTTSTSYNLTAHQAWEWNNFIYNNTLTDTTGVDGSTIISWAPLPNGEIPFALLDIATEAQDTMSAYDTMTIGELLLKASGLSNSNVSVTVVEDLYYSSNASFPPLLSNGAIDFTFTPAERHRNMAIAFIINSPNLPAPALVIPNQLSGYGPTWSEALP